LREHFGERERDMNVFNTSQDADTLNTPRNSELTQM